MTRPVAILRTGAPPEALEPRFGNYPAMFATMLGGVETRAFDVTAGELPDPVAIAGAVVTGSAAGVYENHGWIPPLMDWLRSARGRTRLVGVCFGHQAMAQAFGGRVEKSDRGWGIGLHTYDIAAVEPWMRPPRDRIAIPVSHQDQVVAPPPGAHVIARSDFTPFAGLAWDDDAVSFQCHPEFEPAYAKALIETRRGSRFDDATADAAIASLDAPNDRATLGAWLTRFLTA